MNTDEDPRSIESLAEEYARQPGAFKDRAQVFRTTEERKQFQGGWVLDIPCKDLSDARVIVAKYKDGGRGIYQVVLMDGVSGRRARVAYLRIESDMRDEMGPARAPENGSAVEVLREQLQREQQRFADLERRLTTSAAPGGRDLFAMIDRMQGQIDEQRDRARKAYDEGYDSGFKRGLTTGEAQGRLEGKLASLKAGNGKGEDGSWKPEEVKGIMSEIRQFFRPDAGVESDKHSPNMLDIVKNALAIGLSARQTIEMYRTLRGEEALRAIANALTKEAGKVVGDPEVRQLIEMNPSAEEWFGHLLAELGAVVATGNASAG